MFEDWCSEASNGISGLDDKVARAIAFQARQILDAVAPVNFAPTNPEVVKETVTTFGMNWVKGTMNALEDMRDLGLLNLLFLQPVSK